MRIIHTPAARIQQGDCVLYVTALKVKDLISANVCGGQTFDPERLNDRVRKRDRNVARAKKVADFIIKNIKSWDAQDASLSFSVLLTTEKSIEFNERDHTIEFDTSVVGPFGVIDGQDRLDGLKIAAQKTARVLEGDRHRERPARYFA